jgi:hypothetical protein
MIIIAILLLVAIAAVTFGVFAGAQQDAVLKVFGETVHVSSGQIFVIGAACGFALPIALFFLRLGTRRAAMRRRRTRELRAATERERAELARQREELEAERSHLRNDGLVRPYVGTGTPGDRGTSEGTADGPGERMAPEFTGGPSSPSAPDRDPDASDGQPPRARFEVLRPGAPPAGFGSQSSGLGPPPSMDTGFGSFTRPPRP